MRRSPMNKLVIRSSEGLKNNWIPTAGKKPCLMFRFYGPEEAFDNKTFKLADVELEINEETKVRL